MEQTDLSKKRIGLSLSGGGYRAAAFHLGTLKKLNELGVLKKIDKMSTISGGSITGAAWCLHDGDYNSFHEEMKAKLASKDVIWNILGSFIFVRTILFAVIFLIAPAILSFTSYAWTSFPLLLFFFWVIFKYQYQLFPVSMAIEKAYDQFFFSGKKLKDFREDRPLLAVGSSNLHTGRPFIFSRIKMSDSAYQYEKEFNPSVKFLHDEFPISRAVTASSCVPFAFSPIFIDSVFFENPDDSKRIKPALVDGGVYDNQGIHKLTQQNSAFESDIIITSDAGGQFRANKSYPNVIALLVRTVDLFMYRIKAAQMQKNIYFNSQGAERPIAYFSLGWKLENIIPGFITNMKNGIVLAPVMAALQLDPTWISDPEGNRTILQEYLEKFTGYAEIKNLNDQDYFTATNVGTNLTALSKDQIDCLIRQAENLTELQIKLYCPSLLVSGAINTIPPKAASAPPPLGLA